MEDQESDTNKILRPMHFLKAKAANAFLRFKLTATIFV